MMIDYSQWSAEYRAEAKWIYGLVFDLNERKKKTRNPEEILKINRMLIFYRSALREAHRIARILDDRAKEIEKKQKGK